MLYSSVNTYGCCWAPAMVFFMQAGFSMCEAGFTRAKNTGNILMKNLMDFCIGTPVFWLIGFGLMFGAGNGIIGWFDPTIRRIIPISCLLVYRCGHLLFSRRFSAQPLRPSYPAQWLSAPNSLLTASTRLQFRCLSIRFPVTGSGAAAGCLSSVSTISPVLPQFIWLAASAH